MGGFFTTLWIWLGKFSLAAFALLARKSFLAFLSLLRLLSFACGPKSFRKFLRLLRRILSVRD